MTPILLIGLGATKSGTSWLYQALRDHPECHLRAVKELNFFSAQQWDMHDRTADRLERKIVGLVAKALDGPDNAASLRAEIPDYEAAVAMHAEGSVAAYLDYLNGGAGQAAVVADISPTYAVLREDTLSAMTSVSPDVRFIYVMRDPVDRLWSHVRMHARRMPSGRTDHAKASADVLETVYDGRCGEVASRSDYAGALARFDRALPPESLLVITAEEMFTDAGFARICRHIGIAPQPAPTGKVHEGQHLASDERQRETMTEWLAPQYEAVSQRLGGLPQGWRRISERI